MAHCATLQPLTHPYDLLWHRMLVSHQIVSGTARIASHMATPFYFRGGTRNFSILAFILISSIFSSAQASTKATDAKSSENEPKPFDPPPVLQQLNGALESLSARVSPAVVQILVTGYGSLKEEDRSQTALIVRQHAVGSGVIVDSNGMLANDQRSLRAVF